MVPWNADAEASLLQLYSYGYGWHPIVGWFNYWKLGRTIWIAGEGIRHGLDIALALPWRDCLDGEFCRNGRLMGFWVFDLGSPRFPRTQACINCRGGHSSWLIFELSDKILGLARLFCNLKLGHGEKWSRDMKIQCEKHIWIASNLSLESDIDLNISWIYNKSLRAIGRKLFKIVNKFKTMIKYASKHLQLL